MTILVLASMYSNYVNSMLIDIQVSNMMNVDIIFQMEINPLRMKKRQKCQEMYSEYITITRV